MSAEPTQLRYFVDTNVLGIIATRSHPLRIGYLTLIAAEEFDDRTPSISTIVVNEVEAGLSTLDAGGTTGQHLAAAMRAVLDAFDQIDLDDEGQALADELQLRARGRFRRDFLCAEVGQRAMGTDGRCQLRGMS